jgi:hypothetical protein
MWYHSSQDTPDKLDPTQFKRVAVVGIGAMSVLASAEDEMAMKVAAECLARGSERMGEAERRGLSYLADVIDVAALAQAYKEARNTVRHQAEVEKAVVRSATILFPNPTDGQRRLASLESLVEKRASALQNELDAFYQLRAEQKKVQAAKLELTAAEKEAAKMIAERVGGQGGGFGGPGGGRGAAARASLTEAEQAALRKVPQHVTAELNILMGQKKSVLEIRDFLSGEFEPLQLADLMEYLRVQEKIGTVKITRKP